MKAFYITLALLTLTACNVQPSSDDKLNAQQEQLSMQAANSVGMPAITKFAEKRMMKAILELRDQETPTYAYIVDMNNNLKLICHSVGFGLPYSTQYTNPSKRVNGRYGNLAMPQSDPNGLFSPASADGTWVMCVDPDTKQATPLYIEPRVIISPFKLN
jgi:hypothetical protein